MQVVPLSTALGVELVDFEIGRPSLPAEQVYLRELFLEHHLIAVRGQGVTADDQDRFVGYFGPLQRMRNGETSVYVSNKAETPGRTATDKLLWHSDGAYGARPGIGTSLLALEVSSSSPPTSYANAVRALKNLPSDLRSQIADLRAVFLKDDGKERVWRQSQRRREHDLSGEDLGRVRRYEHPIVYRPPHIDADVLFVNELMTSHVVGMSREESDALIEELFAYLYAPDNTYSLTYQANDLVIWDNIALQHSRPAESGTEPRHLRRVSLDGWNTGEGVIDWPAPGGHSEPMKAMS